MRDISAEVLVSPAVFGAWQAVCDRVIREAFEAGVRPDAEQVVEIMYLNAHGQLVIEASIGGYVARMIVPDGQWCSSGDRQ